MKTAPEKAFNRATAGYELFGKKLLPFSAMRQAVAASMGMRFGLVDAQDIFTVTIEELKGKKKENRDLQFYNQLFSDVVKVLWLCSVNDSRVLRAERRIDEGKLEAFKWADSNGISLTSDAYYSGAAVFFQMMQDISAATGELVPTSGQKPDDDDDSGNE